MQLSLDFNLQEHLTWYGVELQLQRIFSAVVFLRLLGLSLGCPKYLLTRYLPK
jgi:hypothetical protein